jgi:WD40 repeat protein/tRNA A-37 threonylcarbamoyl transferase component Bud32
MAWHGLGEASLRRGHHDTWPELSLAHPESRQLKRAFFGDRELSLSATSGRERWHDATRVGRDVDEACDRFEAAWRAGDRPRIEDFLGDPTDPGYLMRLHYLLVVELDYRSGIGETPESSEYRRRFPGHERMLDSTFARFTGRSGHASGRDMETIGLPSGWDGRSPGTAAGDARDAFPEIPGCEILSELGRGGMGVVYKARQVRLNRLCALKIALPGNHPGAVARARFLAEAKVIARFRHPNVVQIYGLGEHEGLAYFEMEYIEGGSLARWIDGTPWAPEPAARLVAVLARAIGDAHRLGIVHRDLKPANVLLTDDGAPKVVDFGLAKSLEAYSNLTSSGAFIGTPSYAAPEQAEGQSVGPAADIYALGAIFYHLLTGRPPFQAATVLGTLEQVRSADPVPPSRLQPGLPRDVETIALKCLKKDPHRRYADAAALAEDLDRFTAGRPILAQPTGAAERLRKWARRRPAVAALSAAVAAVTLLGIALVAWQWRRAEARAADEAAATRTAQRALLVAADREARLTLHQALALCDQGEVGRGLSWLARALERASEAGAESLDRPIRINLADWEGQLSRSPRLPLMRHTAAILALAFCREGKTLVSVGEDGLARIWETDTGSEIGPPLVLGDDPAGARLKRARFGPGESGLLATVDDRGRVAVWDVNHRRPLSRPPSCPPGQEIRDIAFPNARSLILLRDDGMLSSWTIESRREEPACRPVDESSEWRGVGDLTLAVSSDGRTLAAGGRARRVYRWDVATGRPLGPEFYQDSPVGPIALTPDGRTIITGRRAGRLHVWDARTGRGFDLPRQGTELRSLAVSPDSRVVASGTEGGVVRLWDTSLLGQIGQTSKFDGAVTALAFDPAGRLVAIGQDDGIIGLRQVPRPRALGPPLRVGHSVQSLTFGDGGRRVLIVTPEGSRSWDLTGRGAGEADPAGDGRSNDGPSCRVEPSTVSPDGRTLAITSRLGAGDQTRGRVELRDAATGKVLRQTPDQPHAIAGLAYSPDSRWLLTWGPAPGTARLWDAATLRDPRPLLRSLDSPIHQAVFSRDGRSLLLGCRDARARLWDLRRDTEIDPEHRPRHAYPITAVAFDPGRSRLVTGCHAGTVRVWDANRGTLLHELRQNTGEIVVLAFSPDGAMLATASHDGTARFLDAETGRQLGPALHHADAVLCIAFHPDGKSVVTGTRDGMVQRWGTPAPPRSGSVDEVRRWVRDRTGLEFDDRLTGTPALPDD